MKSSASLSLLSLLAFSVLHCATAADWPGFRGAMRNDIAQEAALLKKWPAEGPTKLWVSDQAGIGYSGYAIVQGVLYTMGLLGDSEHLLAFDALTGSLRWKTPIGPAFSNKWGDGPRGTPQVDGDRVYALSAQGYLLCASARDGKPVWNAALKDFGGKPPGWGYTESVLVDGDRVVCTPGGPQGAMLALHKMTGKKLWQSSEWTDGAQYASIVPVDLHGSRQYLALTMQHLGGIDAQTGRKLWLSPWTGRTAVIPTPIAKANEVYITSGYGVGCKKVRISPNHTAEDVWTNTNMINHHGGVVLVDGFLYGYSDKGGWTCQDWETGELKWTSKSLGKGAIHCAGGMLLLLDEKDGTVALIEASPEAWNEHGRFRMAPQTTQRKPDGRIWTHPVVSEARLYLRDQELLFCYDLRDPSAAKANGLPSPSLASPPSFASVEAAQQAAITKYPALAVQGSPFNRAFLERVKRLQQTQPSLFQNPNWPMLLAIEVAGEQPK